MWIFIEQQVKIFSVICIGSGWGNAKFPMSVLMRASLERRVETLDPNMSVIMRL
jgi:hypothetical protein